MNHFFRYPVMLAVAAIAAAGLSACGGTDHSGMPGVGNSSPSMPAGASFNAADVQFAQMMIPHHAQAVTMADLAAARAADPELKTLAAAIRAAQQPEIGIMTGWLTSWKQPTAQPGGHNMAGMDAMPGMMSGQDMSMLGGMSGTDFDRQFARMMLAHHNGALQMARDVQKTGASPDVKRLAVMIEQGQTAEVTTLQKILDRL